MSILISASMFSQQSGRSDLTLDHAGIPSRRIRVVIGVSATHAHRSLLDYRRLALATKRVPWLVDYPAHPSRSTSERNTR